MLLTNVVPGGPAPERLFLLIHGKGADERDLEPLVSYLDPAGRFLFVLPRAPLELTPGFQWYETIGMPKGGPQFVSSVDALDDLLDDACAEHGFDRSRAVVGGFSQGGAMTLALGLRRSPRPRPAGLLVMSGFLSEAEGVDYDFAGAPPVLIQHGTADPLVPLDLARAATRTLHDAAVPVLYREYPMQHQVALESIRDAATWIDSVVSGARRTEDMDFPPVGGPEEDDDSLVPSVGTETFEHVVLESDLPVIVDFWAPWCEPCKMVAPIVEQIAAMRQGSYRVVKVNIDEEPMLAQTFGVQSIPMVALFRGGRMERTSVGAKPRPALEAELGMLVIP